MRENKINHYFPKSGPHAVFAERVIRTLMNIIYKYISSTNSKKFFDKSAILTKATTKQQLFNAKKNTTERCSTVVHTLNEIL